MEIQEQEKLIDYVVKRTSENVFDILAKNGFEIKEKKTTFQRTEQLLYLVPQLKIAINENKSKIKDLREFGMQITKKGSAVHVVPDTPPIKKDETEIVQSEINKLLQRNHIIDSQIKWVNRILDSVKHDPYYEIIKLKYYDKKTHEDIAEYFTCDEKTIRVHKNQLINHIKTLFFPNDDLNDLGI